MTNSAQPKYHLTNWYIPKSLYDELVRLQENLKGPDHRLKWESVEGLAIHFLAVAVKEAHKELQQKAAQTQIIQPVAVMPRNLRGSF